MRKLLNKAATGRGVAGFWEKAEITKAESRNIRAILISAFCFLLSAFALPGQTIEFLPGAPSVYENGGAAGTNVTVVITRSPATGNSSVQFTSADGSATAPADYAGTNFTVNFVDGESFKVISVGV